MGVVPAMSKLTTLSTDAINVYRILGFFDEEHLPKLKTFRLLHQIELSYLNLWTRHSGVESLTVTINRMVREEEDFGEKLVDVFPAVKKLDFVLSRMDNNPGSIHPLTRIIEPFLMWNLERVNIHAKNVTQSSRLIEVLKIVPFLKGKSSQYIEHFSSYTGLCSELCMKSYLSLKWSL